MSARLGMYMKSAGREAKLIHWLDNAGLYNLNALCDVYHNLPEGAVTILVKWQRQTGMHRKQLRDGRVVDDFLLWTGTRQFELAPQFATGITGPVGEIPAPGMEILTSEPSIQQFLTDSFSRTSLTDRRALMFWGHADGPGSVLFAHLSKIAFQFSGESRLKGMRAFAAPDLDWLSLLEVDQAFTNYAAQGAGADIDLVCFDACQDATLEMAAVLAPHAKFMIGNQSSTPVSGWPFSRWATALDTVANPSINECVKCIVDAYASAKYENSVISAIDLGRVPDVLRALKTVSDLLLADWQHMLPILHRAATLCPAIPNSFADKRDLVKLFSALGMTAATLSPAQQPLATACGALVEMARMATAGKSSCKDTATYGYNGLSIYLPDGSRKMSPYALELYAGASADFANFKEQTRWDEVVQRYALFLFQTPLPTP